MQDLEGKVAVVTGASSGIGKSSAEKLAAEGCNLVLASRSLDELKELAGRLRDEYRVETLPVKTDVTDEKQVEEMVKTAVEEFEKIDIVLNNAGLGIGDSVEDMETGDYRKMMDVNCDGMFFTARQSIPYLREAEGNLIFIGSIAGQYPRAGNPVYSATKWWTRGFAKSLSAQVGDDGIGVTVINPSEVRTKFAGQDGSPFEERFEEGEVTEPEDIAEAVVFAAKQETPNMASEIDMYRRDKLDDL